MLGAAMKTSVVVALCGAKHSGKDLSADWLVQNKGYTHLKFSAPLKDAVASLFGFTPPQMHGRDRESVDPRWDRSPREILQFVGTEMFQYKLQELMPTIGRRFWARTTQGRRPARYRHFRHAVRSRVRRAADSTGSCCVACAHK